MRLLFTYLCAVSFPTAFGTIFLMFVYRYLLGEALSEWQMTLWQELSQIGLLDLQKQRIANSAYFNKIISEIYYMSISTQMASIFSVYELVYNNNIIKDSGFVNQPECSVPRFENQTCLDSDSYNIFKANPNQLNMWFHRNKTDIQLFTDQEKNFYMNNEILSFFSKAIIEASKTQLLQVTLAYNSHITSLMGQYPATLINLSTKMFIADSEYQGTYNYDPRSRIFYKEALANPYYPTFVEPYRFAFGSNKIGMTISQKFPRGDSDTYAILSLDYQIQNFLDQIFQPLDKSNYQTGSENYIVFFHQTNTTVFFHKNWDSIKGDLMSWSDVEYGDDTVLTASELVDKKNFQNRLNEVIQFSKQCSTSFLTHLEDFTFSFSKNQGEQQQAFDFRSNSCDPLELQIFSSQLFNSLSTVVPIQVQNKQQSSLSESLSVVMFVACIQKDQSGILNQETWQTKFIFISQIVQGSLILIAVLISLIRYSAVLYLRFSVPILQLVDVLRQLAANKQSNPSLTKEINNSTVASSLKRSPKNTISSGSPPITKYEFYGGSQFLQNTSPGLQSFSQPTKRVSSSRQGVAVKSRQSSKSARQAYQQKNSNSKFFSDVVNKPRDDSETMPFQEYEPSPLNLKDLEQQQQVTLNANFTSSQCIYRSNFQESSVSFEDSKISKVKLSDFSQSPNQQKICKTEGTDSPLGFGTKSRHLHSEIRDSLQENCNSFEDEIVQLKQQISKNQQRKSYLSKKIAARTAGELIGYTNSTFKSYQDPNFGDSLSYKINEDNQKSQLFALEELDKEEEEEKDDDEEEDKEETCFISYFQEKTQKSDSKYHLRDIQQNSIEISVLVETFSGLFQIISFIEEGFEKENSTDSLLRLGFAANVFKYVNNLQAVGIAYYDIGHIYFREGLFQDAINFYSKSIFYCMSEFEVSNVRQFMNLLAAGTLQASLSTLRLLLPRFYFAGLAFKEAAVAPHTRIHTIARDTTSKLLFSKALSHFTACLKLAEFLMKKSDQPDKLRELSIFIKLFLCEVYAYLDDFQRAEILLNQSIQLLEDITKNSQLLQNSQKEQQSQNMQVPLYDVNMIISYVKGIINLRKENFRDGCSWLTHYLENSRVFSVQQRCLNYLRNAFQEANIPTTLVDKRIKKINQLPFEFYFLIDKTQQRSQCDNTQQYYTEKGKLDFQVEILTRMKEQILSIKDRVSVMSYGSSSFMVVSSSIGIINWREMISLIKSIEIDDISNNSNLQTPGKLTKAIFQTLVEMKQQDTNSRQKILVAFTDSEEITEKYQTDIGFQSSFKRLAGSFQQHPIVMLLNIENSRKIYKEQVLVDKSVFSMDKYDKLFLENSNNHKRSPSRVDNTPPFRSISPISALRNKRNSILAQHPRRIISPLLKQLNFSPHRRATKIQNNPGFLVLDAYNQNSTPGSSTKHTRNNRETYSQGIKISKKFRLFILEKEMFAFLFQERIPNKNFNALQTFFFK